MKVLPSRVVVKLASLVASEDFGRYLEMPCVGLLAHRLRTGRTLITPVSVRFRDMRVCTGIDVVAAHVINGSYEIHQVIALDCDQDEMLAMRTVDESRVCSPVDRWAVPAAVEAINLVAARVNPLTPAGKPKVKSPRQQAREDVALILGVSVEALRKQDQRAQTPRMPRSEPTAPWELDVGKHIATAELLADSRAVLDTLASIDRLLRHSVANLGKLDSARRFGEDRRARLSEALSQAGKLTRSMLPDAMCPYCKDVAVVREQCSACWGGGYVTAIELQNSETVLLEHDCVRYEGRLVEMHDLRKPFRVPLNESYVEPVFDDTQPGFVDDVWQAPAPPDVPDIIEETEPEYIDPLDRDW